ncbi:ATP-binding cassette domain-containing protein, partial [Pirellulales bacterium]|nr:ATP-binding cassette domain-containing protein [Pirellulales bacterium]
MIELQNLQFAHADGEFALRVESLTINKGQRVCWIGPSGSGKTTLLHLVAGIFFPESGRVKTCGVELSGRPEGARRDYRIANIGLVFQDFALLDYLSMRDNILLPYRINRALQMDSAVRERAEQLAAAVGMGEMLSRRPTHLSQGERQRVAVCRALIANPKLLLADEPTANLDASNATRVLDALDDYAAKHGATLVVVSHDRDVVARFGDTIDVSQFCINAQIAAEGG